MFVEMDPILSLKFNGLNIMVSLFKIHLTHTPEIPVAKS